MDMVRVEVGDKVSTWRALFRFWSIMDLLRAVDWDEFYERFAGLTGVVCEKSDQSEVQDSGSHSPGLVECVVWLSWWRFNGVLIWP